MPLASLVGDPARAAQIDPSRYASDAVGPLTLRDMVEELKKPGRDPRERFEPPKFRDDVREMTDLKPGMQLEGVVTNARTSARSSTWAFTKTASSTSRSSPTAS